MIANSITKLQTTVRCWLARKKFLRDRKAAVSVQAWIRGEQVRASVGREMQELVRKRKEKEAQEAETARLVAEEREKQLEEQALSVRLAQVRKEGPTAAFSRVLKTNSCLAYVEVGSNGQGFRSPSPSPDPKPIPR